MAKLEKLSADQKALMLVVRDEWINFALNSDQPMDKVAAKKGIEWMYGLAKLKAPEIVYTESPIACQIIANLYGNPKIRASVWASVRDSVGDSVGDSVWDSVRASVRDSVRDSVWDSVWDSVGARVGDSVGASVGDSVRDSVGDSVWDSVRASVGDSVGDSLKYMNPAWWDVLSDAGWVAFYDFFIRIGVINHEDFNRYTEYMKAGVFYCIFLDGIAIICGRPKYISRDERGRLHAEDKPAILWNDGYAQYFWHGVEVAKAIIETPEQLTREDLIHERNAEVRRAMMEKLGSGRFMQLLDVIEVDRDFVGSPGYRKEYVLWQTREIDPVAGEHLQFVDVVCHSTEREYILCVPPDIKDVWSGVAWTFGKSKEEYEPLVEA